MDLTAKQERFCEEYLIDLNASQAAIRAGYSPKTAGQIGEQNLKKLEIQTRITELKQGRSERTNIQAEIVLSELAKIGFSNIQDYIEEGNSIKDLSQIPREMAASVKSIKQVVTEWGSGDHAGTKTSVTFELYDKLGALEKIGRHLGIFEMDNKQKSSIIRVVVEDE
jgi:phage terminase small subunit